MSKENNSSLVVLTGEQGMHSVMKAGTRQGQTTAFEYLIQTGRYKLNNDFFFRTLDWYFEFQMKGDSPDNSRGTNAGEEI